MKKRAVGCMVFLVMIIAGASCKKEFSCEGCRDGNLPPKALAGQDMVIQIPLDSAWLDGRGSSDPDGSIATYAWRRIAGPSSAIIVSPADSLAKVRSLVAGIYQFALTVTDNGGLTSMDTVQVTVLSQDQQRRPPVACAGPDQSIILPVNTVTLDGRCSADPDNDIAAYQWTKLSGPAAFRIASPDQPLATLTDLAEGSFVFQLTVRDISGLMSTDTVRITVNPLPVEEDGVDIYVAGNENSAPKYWKNGQGVDLRFSSGTNGHATDIAVEGNDVYVAGWEGDWLYMRDNRAKYWKNGQEVFLTGSTGAGANAIAVSGNDVYVAGWELKSQPGISVAKYWKNGVAVALTDGSHTAEAMDIAVVGGDVYVSGYDGDIARCWKNGQLVWSANATTASYAYGMKVIDADVYLAGMRDRKPVYWKNGDVFTLSSEEGRSSAVFVDGTDVYVAGELRMMLDGTVGRYWKNGQETTLLTAPGGTSIASSIFVLDNDVYVTGFDYTTDYRGGYWKNGQFVQVGPPGTTQTSSIVVKRR